jgi:hypothetical protein
MSDTKTEVRGSALDSFVKMRDEAPPAQMPMVVNQPADMMIHGAQEVAVRRDEERVLQRLRVLAAGMGEQYYYRFPVKNKKTGKTDYIEGPSVKLANDLCRVYGNCEVDCRAQDMGDSWLFHARFIDLETGYSLTRPFQARKSGSKLGGSDDERRLDSAFQIGASKAIRNVVLNALQSFSDFAFDEARNALVDRIAKEGIERWRERTAERIGNLVSLDRVEAAVGRKQSEWLAPDVSRIIAMGKAISDGMATVDETFPPLRSQEANTNAKQQIDNFVADPTKEVVDPKTGEVSTEAEVKAKRGECISKLMAFTTDPGLTDAERLALLESAKPIWIEATGDRAFVVQAAQIVARVINGDLKTEPAQKFLQQLRG